MRKIISKNVNIFSDKSKNEQIKLLNELNSMVR